LSSKEVSGDKVVLGGGVGLHNVSSLSSDIQVKDSLKSGETSRSWSNVEYVRSILEGSSELSGIKSQSQVQSVLSNSGILMNRGVSSISSPINETTRRIISVGSQINSGNIVTESENAVAVVVYDARLLVRCGESPVVAGLVSINSATQVIVSGINSRKAVWSRKVKSGNFNPVVFSSSAVNFIVLRSLNSSGILALESALHVLRVGLVESAPCHIGGQDGNIDPGRRSPVRVVVSLLWALVTVSVSIVILAGIGGLVSNVTLGFSVGNEKSTVSLSGRASIIENPGLVLSIEELSIGVDSSRSIGIVGDGISGGSISYSG